MHGFKKIYCLTILIFINVNYSTLVLAEQTIILNITGGPPLNTVNLDGFMDQVTKEALRRLGYKLETVMLPAERALLNSNNGVIDGEMSRISGLNKRYTNLIQVNEKIIDWEFVAFSKKNINLNNRWQSLKPYSVSIINGWKILEKNIPSNVDLTKVKNPDQLFGMLLLKRADLIIYGKWAGSYYLKSNNMHDVKIINPPLTIKPLYIYLHKKHTKLAKKLAKSLKNMKQDGTYQKIKSKTIYK
jgi:polar amino acid transport system substrate-binding protein